MTNADIIEITIKDGRLILTDPETLRIRNGLELFADGQGFTAADLVNLASMAERASDRLMYIAELVADDTLTEKQRLSYIGRLAGTKKE